MEIPELQMLLDAVEKQYGRPIATTNDFNTLSAIIEYECREVLSSATLKRLWGYVSLRTTPRRSTLDILARYAGFADFSDFRTSFFGKVDETSGYMDVSYLSAADVLDGAIVRFGWAPNRLIRARKVEKDCFEIVESINSKLLAGDVFECSCFFKGLPLILPFVRRGGALLPSFVAGKTTGLNQLLVEA